MARKPIEYTEEQQAALDAAKVKYSEYRRSRKTALERARLAAEAEVAERRREAAKALLAAYQAGVSMRAIGRQAMKTSDYVTIRSIIGEVDLDALKDERAEQVAAQSSQERDKEVTVKHLHDITYLVTLSGSELEQAKVWANWDTHKEVPAEHRSAEFELHENGFWLPITEGWLDELAEEHPVVVYASKDAGREKLREALT